MSDVDHAARNHRPAPQRRAMRLTVVPDEPPTDSAATLDTRKSCRPQTATSRGRLLAVCGLCGGAGTSTLAYLIALAAARSSNALVLVADTGGPSGAISCYAGVQAPRSLPELAEHVTAGLPTGQLVATTSDGVRVLATGPRFTPACARDGIELLLEHARQRYALTVIDCGTLARQADQIALASASHVAWVLPATVSGVLRASRVLDAINLSPPGGELLVARRDERGRKAAHRELKRLAQQRHATLVLVPTSQTSPTARPTLCSKPRRSRCRRSSER
jgi:Flp pilus assembly CpaE family ATPase